MKGRINTGIDFIASIASLRGNIGVILGDEGRIRKLKSYNLQTGAEVKCLNIGDAWGLAEVMISGRRALAVTRKVSLAKSMLYLTDHRIIFRHILKA